MTRFGELVAVSDAVAATRSRTEKVRKLADFLQHARSMHELGALQRRVFSESRQHALLARASRRAVVDRPPFHPELATLAADQAQGRGQRRVAHPVADRRWLTARQHDLYATLVKLAR